MFSLSDSPPVSCSLVSLLDVALCGALPRTTSFGRPPLSRGGSVHPPVFGTLLLEGFCQEARWMIKDSRCTDWHNDGTTSPGALRWSRHQVSLVLLVHHCHQLICSAKAQALRSAMPWGQLSCSATQALHQPIPLERTTPTKLARSYVLTFSFHCNQC